MIKLWGILKGLLVQETSDRTKQLSIEVNPSATTATRTTLQSSQTADRTINLPDASDTLVGKDTVDVLQNKEIDADLNTITNIENADIKVSAAIDATKIADGSVSNDEFQYINSLTSNAQTQINAKQSVSEKGAANGYASLDGDGLLPVSQLPPVADDVLEYADLASFPVTGETGKLYIAADSNNVYRWSGSAYVQVATASTGANQTLSNLTSPTAINQHLLPGAASTYDIGAFANPMRNLFGKEALFGSSGQRGTLSVVDTNGSTVAKVLTAMVSSASLTSGVAGITVEGADTVLISGTVDKKILVETKNNAAGNSGDISIQTGTATGTRGEIALKGRQVNVNSSKIVNAVDPTAAQDVATKAYVDLQNGSNSNYTESTIQNLGTISWNSSTPGGTVSKKYKWTKIGKTVDFYFWYDYTGTGTSNTFSFFDIPGDLPAYSDYTANSLNNHFAGSANVGNGGSVGTPAAAHFLGTKVYVVTNGASTSNEVHGHIRYFTD